MRYFQSCRRHPFRSDWASRMQALGAIKRCFFFVWGERIGTSTRQEDRKCELGKSLESSLIPYWEGFDLIIFNQSAKIENGAHAPKSTTLIDHFGCFCCWNSPCFKSKLTSQELPVKCTNPEGATPPQKKKGGRRFQIPRYLHDDLVNFCYTYINSQPVKSRHFRLVILDFFRPPVPAEQTRRLLQAMNQLPRPLMVQHLGPTQKRGWTGGSWFMVLIDSYSSLIFFKFLVSPVSSTDIHVLSVSCVPNVEYNR